MTFLILKDNNLDKILYSLLRIHICMPLSNDYGLSIFGINAKKEADTNLGTLALRWNSLTNPKKFTFNDFPTFLKKTKVKTIYAIDFYPNTRSNHFIDLLLKKETSKESLSSTVN